MPHRPRALCGISSLADEPTGEIKGNSRAAALAKLGIAKVDDSELIALCEKRVADNPKIVADVRAGKLQAAGGFVGQAKKLNPNVNPAQVREICLEMIGRMG